MPPKGAPGTAGHQHTRKPSATAAPVDRDPASAKEKGKGKEKSVESEKSAAKKDKDDSEIMPPPPPPPSKPLVILEPELGALEESLKTITITTAQIFRFYADTKRLGLQNRAPRPPRSMTHDLERELGRYDQICDTIDAQLTRAIVVLQRDLTREENRIREEEAEKARAKAAEASAADKDIEMANVSGSSTEAADKQQRTMPSGALAGTGKVPLRRPSKISLSTLHRSPFPLKLDLSSTSLRLGSDEGLNLSALDNLNALTSLGSMGVDGISGLASPVTLAPKSARPMGPDELPPEVLAVLASASGVGAQNIQIPDPSQHVDIDLTLDDDLQVPANLALLNSGNTADKPIELDLELDVQMSDLPADIFGEQEDGGVQQPGPPTDADMEKLFGPDSSGVPDTTDTNGTTSGMDISMLLPDNPSHDDALFASLDSKSSGSSENALNSQSGTDPAQNEGSGDGTAFDISMFFNDAANQEQIDMMEQFLKMENAEAPAGAPDSTTVPPSAPPENTG